MQGDDDNNSMIDDKNRYRSSEAQEWYFRLMNDPEQFEKERYIDSINVYNSIIEEFKNYMTRQQRQIIQSAQRSLVE
jgi:vacuolar-type H+-ATPase subunit E/Vma4